MVRRLKNFILVIFTMLILAVYASSAFAAFTILSEPPAVTPDHQEDAVWNGLIDVAAYDPPMTYTLISGPDNFSITQVGDDAELEWTPQNRHVSRGYWGAVPQSITIHAEDAAGIIQSISFDIYVDNRDPVYALMMIPPIWASGVPLNLDFNNDDEGDIPLNKNMADADPKYEVSVISGTGKFDTGVDGNETGEITFWDENFGGATAYKVTAYDAVGVDWPAVDPWATFSEYQFTVTYLQNQAPLADNWTFTGFEGDPPFTIDLSTYAADPGPPGLPLTYKIVDDSEITAIGASLNLAVDFSDTGILEFDPSAVPDWNGTVRFTYQVYDGGLWSSEGTIRIAYDPVNDQPKANAANETTAEDTPLTINLDSLVTDVDLAYEGDTFTYTIVSGPSQGTAVFTAPNEITYTPNADWSGSDNFEYEVTDAGGLTDSEKVDITVTPVNDAPSTVQDSYSVDEGATIDTVADGLPGVLDNDTDVEGDPLEAVWVSGPANGTLTLDTDGSFVYIHDGSEVSSDSFIYKAYDGADYSVETTVVITINPINDAPKVNDDAYSVDEGGTLTVAAPGVLDNDTDAESDPLEAIWISGPANGALTLNVDGSFEYIHDGSEVSSDSFTYNAYDGVDYSGQATVTITINNVNDAPAASDVNVTTDEDVAVTIDLSTGANDPEGDPLTYSHDVLNPLYGSLSGFDPNTGILNYTPTHNYNGSFTFSYSVEDDKGASATANVNVTVNPVSDPPEAALGLVFVQEDSSIDINLYGHDADGDPITWAITSGPTHGTLTNFDPATGAVTYTPDADYNGADSFDYSVTAVDGTDTGGLSISVNEENDPPEALDDTASTDEDTAVTIDLAANDSDPDGDTLTYTIDTDPSNGTVTIDPSGSAVYTPNADYVGTDTFVYQVSDPYGATDTANVTVTINGVVDAPVAVDDVTSVTEGATLNVSAPGVMANDYDPDGDAITAVLVDNPTYGTVTLNADGSYTYEHDGSEEPTDSFTYYVTDGGLDSNTATVTITVTGVNDPPTFPQDTLNDLANLEAWEGTYFEYEITITDPDLGDTLTYSLLNVPAEVSAWLSIDATSGVMSGTPDYDAAGEYDFQVYVEDAAGESATADAHLTVHDVNRPPEFVEWTPTDFALEVSNADAVDFSVLAVDPDGDDVVYSWNASFGEFTTVDGSISQYTTQTAWASDQVGTASIVITATDPQGAFAALTYEIEVVVADQAPPVITATVHGTQGNDNWYITQNPYVELTATDDSGVALIGYYLDSDPATEVAAESTTCTVPEDIHSFSFYAEDNYGNRTEVYLIDEIKVDTIAPEIEEVAVGAEALQEGVTASLTLGLGDQSISAAVTDSGSGVSEEDIVIKVNGGAVEVNAVDGVVGLVAVEDISVETSGVDALQVGANQIVVEAEDVAGNTASRTFDVSAEDLITNPYCYPVPWNTFSGDLTVAMSATEAGNPIQVRIYDEVGRMVKLLGGTTVVGNNRITCDTSNAFGERFQNGLYTGRILVNGQYQAKIRFVVVNGR